MALADLDFTMVDDVDIMAQRIRKAAVYKHLISLEVPSLPNNQYGPGQVTGALAAAQAVVDGIQGAGDTYYDTKETLTQAVRDAGPDAFSNPGTVVTGDALLAAKAALKAHVDTHAITRRDVLIVD